MKKKEVKVSCFLCREEVHTRGIDDWYYEVKYHGNEKCPDAAELEDGLSYDLCSECYDSTLMPWLRSQERI